MLSRVADSLYWMSRYLERAEHSARLIEVHMNQLVERLPGLSPEQRWARLHFCLQTPVPDGEPDSYELTMKLALDASNSTSVTSYVAAARENARQVREQISSEMWGQLNQLYLDLTRRENARMWSAQPYKFFTAVREGSHLFQGITDATMNHNEGWHFIQLGRFIERTLLMSDLLDGYFTFAPATSDDYFDWLYLLKSATSFEAYCKIYHNHLRPDWIADFLLFNQEFPRSARFCIEMILASLNPISGATTLHKNSRIHRLVGRSRSSLSFDEIGDVMAGDMHHYLADVKQQAVQIHGALYETFIAYPVDTALVS